MDATLRVVRGKRLDTVSAGSVRVWATRFARTVIEVGTGNGRWLYRLARSCPRSACIGIDANSDGMREISYRASRKPARGGIPNVLFAQSAVATLPEALEALADEIYVLYPWGSLLRGVWVPEVPALSAIARLARPGARLEVRINVSAVVDQQALLARLSPVYARAGIRLVHTRVVTEPVRTTWAMKIAHGRDPRVLLLEGTMSGLRSQVSDET